MKISKIKTLLPAPADGKDGDKGDNGADAWLYKLVPSVDAIVRRADGTMSPATFTCAVTKNVGGTQTTPSSTEYTLRSVIDDKAEQAYTAGAAVFSSAVSQRMTFRLYVGGILADSATVSVIADGEDGKDGKDGQNGKDGKDGTSFTVQGAAEMHFDSRAEMEQYITEHWEWFPLNKVGTTCYLADEEGAGGSAWLGTVVSSPSAVQSANFTNPEDGIAYTTSDRHLWVKNGAKWIDLGLIQGPKGDDGATGKTGPFWYPAGSWSATVTYRRTETLVPVVEHKGYYWYMATEEDTSSRGDEPTAASTVWKLADMMAFVFTEALFAAFAKLGSAVMTGDWMISQHGTIDGMVSTDYQKFTASDPQGVLTGNFCPSFAVDLLTGKAYLGEAVMTGTLRTRAVYTVEGGLKTAGGRNTLDLDDSPGNAFVVPGNTTVYVPMPEKYEGLTLTVIFSRGGVLACEEAFYTAYYTEAASVVTEAGMSISAFHSNEGLEILTLQAIRAYGNNSGVKWIVTAQRGVLGIRLSVTGADAYRLLPDGRLLI